VAHAIWSAVMKSGNDKGQQAGRSAKDQRAARLKRALRENLKRRKSQARERSDTTPRSGSDDVDHDHDEESPG